MSKKSHWTLSFHLMASCRILEFNSPPWSGNLNFLLFSYLSVWTAFTCPPCLMAHANENGCKSGGEAFYLNKAFCVTGFSQSEYGRDCSHTIVSRTVWSDQRWELLPWRQSDAHTFLEKNILHSLFSLRHIIPTVLLTQFQSSALCSGGDFIQSYFIWLVFSVSMENCLRPLESTGTGKEPS